MISLDCNEGVCPLVIDVVATCQVTGTVIQWTVLPDMMIPAISQALPESNDFGYTAMFAGNGGSTLSANTTTDKNGTMVKCVDFILGGPDDTCMITIAG